jgi:hypothetical protein
VGSAVAAGCGAAAAEGVCGAGGFCAERICAGGGFLCGGGMEARRCTSAMICVDNVKLDYVR